MASPPRADSDFDGQRQCPIPKTSSKMLRGKLGGESLFYPTMGWRPAIQQLEPLKAGGKPIVFFFFPSEGNMLRGGGQSTFSMSSTIVLDARAKPETRATKYWREKERSKEAKLLSSAVHNGRAQKPRRNRKEVRSQKKKEKEIFFSLLKYTAIYIYIYIRIGLRSRNRRVCQLWKCCILQRERKPRRWQLREAAAYPFRV